MGCYVGGDFLCQFGSGIVKWKHVPRDCGLYVGLVVFGLSVVLTVYIFLGPPALSLVFSVSCATGMVVGVGGNLGGILWYNWWFGVWLCIWPFL